MELTFTLNGREAYKLIKLDPGWELQKYDPGHVITAPGAHKGKKTKAGWKKMASGNGLYPHSIRHALDLIADDIILSHKNEKLPVVDGLRLIRTEVGKLEGVLDAKEREFLHE